MRCTDGGIITNNYIAIVFKLKQASYALCVLNYRFHDVLVLLMAGMHMPRCRLGLQSGLLKAKIEFIMLSIAKPVGVQTEYGVNSSKPDFLA